jgi:hypothetical protein
MALFTLTDAVIKDRVKELSSTTGTSSFVLTGAEQGYNTFEQVGDGRGTFYCAVNEDASEWEVAPGIYTSVTRTLSRDSTSIQASSNNGSIVSFSAGTKYVFCVLPAYLWTLVTLLSRAISTSATTTVISLSNTIGSNNAHLTVTTGISTGPTPVTLSTNAGDLLLSPTGQLSLGGYGSTGIVLASGGGVFVNPMYGAKGLSVGYATPGDSGLAFPATAVAVADANTLDDYEEGTFTPTLEGITTAGVTTYLIQTGKYVKIGSLVYFKLSLLWSNQTGTGNFMIRGLPFNSAADGTTTVCAMGMSNVNYTAGSSLYGAVQDGAAIVYPTQAANGAVAAGVPVDTAGSISMSGSYGI